MRRFPARVYVVVPATLLLGAALVSAQQGPVASMYSDDQQRAKSMAVGFATAAVPATGNAPAAQIYLTTGDLQRAFDNARFRPTAAIVPTNSELQLTAKAPATQQVLIDRLRTQPEVLKALQSQIDARPGRGSAAAPALEVGIGSFVATLSRAGQSPGAFPSTVCLLATDFPGGGAIDRRELFTQDRLRKGIAGCLSALDAAGAQSVVVPLVGAASSGTQANDTQYEGQRALMECRLTNAIAALGLGIHDFAPTRRNLRELGIIQWEQELLEMFGARGGAPMSRTAQAAFRTYATQVKQALRNGLAGKQTTSSDVAGGCTGVLNAK